MGQQPSRFLLIVLITCFAFINSSLAADIYVDQSAPAGGNGLSWATAFQDIESAVNIAAANDRVLIAEGIYQPVNEIDILVPLIIIGGYPSGGGLQNIALHTTQIQADFDPVNVLPVIFDIFPNSDTTLNGLRFQNGIDAIESDSNINLSQVIIQQFSSNGITFRGNLIVVNIDNSEFLNIDDDVLRGFSMTLQDLNITNTLFDTCMDRLISFGDDLSNLTMRDCTIRNLNNSTSAIELDTTAAIISSLTVVNNTSTSGAIINFRDSNVTMSNSRFDNNDGDGTICIQGNATSQLNLSDSVFTNNSSIGTFPSPIFSMRDVTLNVTNCLFEGNFAQGSQPDVIGQFRSDSANLTTTFDNCSFLNNTSLGSIPNIMEIGYGAYGIVNNCVFDGNTTDANFLGITSVNPIGFEITNNTFINHTVNEPLINMYNTNNVGNIVLTGNRFDNNTFTELNIGRFASITSSDNQFNGDNIDVTFDRTISLTSTNDYFRGNSTGSEFMSFRDITVNMEQAVMISTAASGTHTLIDSGNNSSLDIVNSTFSSSSLNNTHVSLDFDDDLASTLENTIVWSNSGNLTQSGLTGTTGNLTINHSLVKGENPAGTGNMNGTIAANAPVFVNPTAFDFRMQRCSPTINQGLNTYSSQANDYQGNNRVFETTIDLGAYEIQEPFNVNCITPPVPLCTTLITPANGDIDVNVNSSISWNPVPEAIGYILQIGSTPGANDIVDVTLGNTTSYSLSNALSFDSQIYVTIIPFNGSGNAVSCTEESFFTLARPNCTNLSLPTNGAVNVAVDTNITWNTVPNVLGYNIAIGTTSGSDNILRTSVGDINSFDIPFDLAANTTYYITISPYNAAGTVSTCTETSFTTDIIPAPPQCTTIIAPLDNATDIAIDTDISWNSSPSATGYFISIGTAPGLTDVLNNFDNGNSTVYNPPVNFAEGTIFYVIITPYNTAGNATGCAETSFTTEIIIVAPSCTTIITPADGAIDVAITSDINWNAEPTATGYLISIGTAPGLTDVLNNFDNGNSTTYNPPVNFAEGSTFYVTITPYNTAGNATGCAETSFTTEVIIVAPSCATIITPADGAIDVAITSNINWNAEPTATGYLISIGTATGLTDVLNNFDNGNSTTYNPPVNFAEGTNFYVTITPYNTAGNATGCAETSFTTEVIIVAPSCATIITPADGAIDVAITSDINWNAEPTATGYFISIGTATGLTDVLNNFDNGNSTTYNPPVNFAEGSTFYVTITPYNTAGNATGCAETSFTTEVIIVAPSCTTIITPADGAIDEAITSDISWNAEPTATGYLISIGTATGLTDVLNNFDNGNSTIYNPPVNFAEGSTFYVTITPYNTAGNATGCVETSFTTEVIIVAPSCSTIISPVDGAVDVDVNTFISWNFSPQATGYFISIGITPNGNESLDNFDNGNATTYGYSQNFPEGTLLYVTITPYNNLGTSVGCESTVFTTQKLDIIIPEYFTPNQDGFHDFWNIEDPTSKIAAVYIFDKYGKLLQSIYSAPYIWEGIFNDSPLPSSDYWYRIELKDGKIITGHFTLKR